MPSLHSSADEKNQSQWFKEWFNHPLYLELYSHRNREEASDCVNMILQETGLETTKPSGPALLDIACGAGRHALEFARKGFDVTANDLSAFLLQEAQKEAAQESLELRFTGHDMRNISESGSYRMVVQLFTSFGYFDSADEDRKVVSAVFRALQSDGWYVLDLINPSHLKRHLVQHSTRRAGGMHVEENRVLEESLITKQITITPETGKALEFSESVRLYSSEEITAMLENEGFALDFIIGDYSGSPFSEGESPRMILFSKKR
ncbi:MAG: class I SAM-dependent methyltransferase [Chlorobium sp.]|nr:class I SAM-dependent methyltransferase [Chlorobium phaeovibrioides]NQU46585.1 class I SAM-dependent methyltransferase [Chlorobium sp.]